jgi:ATP-dependent RNA helicase DDX3X
MMFSATFPKRSRDLAKDHLAHDHVRIRVGRAGSSHVSKRTADEIDDYLFNLDLPCTSIHSDRTQREREDALRAFRTGKCPIMVATGVSARGLDIKNVMHVINYDLPSLQYGGIDEYIHRIGKF